MTGYYLFFEDGEVVGLLGKHRVLLLPGRLREHIEQYNRIREGRKQSVVLFLLINGHVIQLEKIGLEEIVVPAA